MEGALLPPISCGRLLLAPLAQEGEGEGRRRMRCFTCPLHWQQRLWPEKGAVTASRLPSLQRTLLASRWLQGVGRSRRTLPSLKQWLWHGCPPVTLLLWWEAPLWTAPQ